MSASTHTGKRAGRAMLRGKNLQWEGKAFSRQIAIPRNTRPTKMARAATK
jgi:hypothetical protein